VFANMQPGVVVDYYYYYDDDDCCHGVEGNFIVFVS
jgi:hypothetical protein